MHTLFSDGCEKVKSMLVDEARFCVYEDPKAKVDGMPSDTLQLEFLDGEKEGNRIEIVYNMIEDDELQEKVLNLVQGDIIIAELEEGPYNTLVPVSVEHVDA